MVKAIDVSTYQGLIDWNKVKKSEMNHAILKIVNKSLQLDGQFDNNYKGCLASGVDIIGVYNYSYATTTLKGKSDAESVVNILNSYHADKNTVVWLDIEDNCQKRLGDLLLDIINAYATVVISNGYQFGIYTGLNFYNTYLKKYSSIFTCPFWIAKYSSGKPSIPNKLYAWQYTSSGEIDGINGNVDVNELYTYVVEEDIKMSENYASKVINIALAEVGYLEKKNGNISYLYDKTSNAGTANYTKYGKEMHDIYPSIMDYPASWCDACVDWCFNKAYGISNAKGLLGGDFNDYTVASAQLYKNKGAYYKKNPKVGDQIFFKNSSGGICHTGLVYAVDSKRVYTIEGNTSSASGVVANGGCVAKKSYLLTYTRIDGYGRPKYDAEPSTSGYTYNGLDYSQVFDLTYYCNNQPDVVKALGTSLSAVFGHFINNGMKEGRQAISTFNVNTYKNNYADLRSAFGDDLVKYYQHYITNGHNEGRIAI